MASKGNLETVKSAAIVVRRALTIAIFTAIIFSGLLGTIALAQSAPDLTGNWQGTVEAGRGFRIILQVSAADRGQVGKSPWQGTFYTVGVGGTRESYVPSLTLDGTTFRFTIVPDGSFDGKLSADSKSIAGTLKYGGGSYAVSLERATADAAWEVPKPTDHMPPDATPEFEVATIKPEDPADPHSNSQGFHLNGRRVSCTNETVDDMISIAYRVQARQIVGGPAWRGTDKYNVDGVPDLAGEPNLEQMRGMYRSLLTSRFSLALHHETKELPAYALRIGKNGPKLARSFGDPKGTPDQTYNRDSQLIDMKETNATIAEFAEMIQDILEKPVVDQTGLTGRFDFRMRWTPEGAQTTDPNAPPSIFTAMQEQLGLRLEATKAPVDVLVIDHVDRPSEN